MGSVSNTLGYNLSVLVFVYIFQNWRRKLLTVPICYIAIYVWTAFTAQLLSLKKYSENQGKTSTSLGCETLGACQVGALEPRL